MGLGAISACASAPDAPGPHAMGGASTENVSDSGAGFGLDACGLGDASVGSGSESVCVIALPIGAFGSRAPTAAIPVYCRIATPRGETALPCSFVIDFLEGLQDLCAGGLNSWSAPPRTLTEVPPIFAVILDLGSVRSVTRTWTFEMQPRL